MPTPRPAVRLALLAALSLTALAAPAGGARADEPPRLEVEVGQALPLGGYAAHCDDLSVVSVTLGPKAVVTGLKPGTTLCSVAVDHLGGARRVYRIAVTLPPPGRGGAGAPDQSERR